MTPIGTASSTGKISQYQLDFAYLPFYLGQTSAAKRLRRLPRAPHPLSPGRLPVEILSPNSQVRAALSTPEVACLLPGCLVPLHIVRRVRRQVSRYQTAHPTYPSPQLQRTFHT